MQRGGRVVGGVDAREGVADALAEAAVGVGAPHPFVHRLGKRLALDVHVLPDLRQHHGVARVLADGHLLARGGVGVGEHRL